MGYYFGTCPKCKQDINFHDSDFQKFFDEEYENGYKDGFDDTKSVEEYKKENENIRMLLEANCRVLTQKIREELKASG